MIILGSIKTGTWADNFAARLANREAGERINGRKKKEKENGALAKLLAVRLPLTLARRVAQRREIS
jgi:hypothetical protein